MDHATALAPELTPQVLSPAAAPVTSAPDEATVDAERRPGLWPPSPERVLLAILLVGVALTRLAWPGLVEPNVSNVEAGHLAAIEAMLVDRGPGVLGLTAAGASDLALGPPLLLRVAGREPELALRFYAALASVGLVAAFYGLCRARYGVLVSLAASAMLALGPWGVFFGRNGEMNAFVALWMVAAIWLLGRAEKMPGLRGWVLAGAASAAGVYWHPAAIWVPPTLLLVGLLRTFEEPARRPRLMVGLIVFVVAATIVAGPRLVQFGTRGNVVSATLDEHGGPGIVPAIGVRAHVQQAVRSFLLLDPTVTGDPRYKAPDSAPLDGLTGVLLLAGIGLAIWRPRLRADALLLFAVPLFGSQLTGPLVPDLGRAIVALPGLYLLVASAIEAALGSLPFRSVMSAALLVAIPVYGLLGWQSYSGWMGSSLSAQARQPALDYDEVDAWLAEQHDRLAAGAPPMSVAEWRQDHPRLATGPRSLRRSRDAAARPEDVAIASLGLDPGDVFQGPTDAAAARGVAALPTGDVFTADEAGRVSRLDAERGNLVPLGPSPALQQIAEVAADPSGQLILADAERGLLLRLDSRGTVLASFGQDWGMYRPRGLAIGPDGTIYVADTGRNRIVVASSDGKLQKTLGPRTSAGDLEQPTDVAVDASGRIYVALPEVGRLVVLDDSGQVLGGWPIAKGNTVDSTHIAVVADGAVAITEPSERRVWLADADGRELARSESTGRPYGVATASGRLFVTEPTTGRLLTFSLRSR